MRRVPHRRPEAGVSGAPGTDISQPGASGMLWTAVRWIMERETGGVLQTGERCTNTGYKVMEVLRAKHPEARAPTVASLDSYPD